MYSALGSSHGCKALYKLYLFYYKSFPGRCVLARHDSLGYPGHTVVPSKCTRWADFLHHIPQGLSFSTLEQIWFKKMFKKGVFDQYGSQLAGSGNLIDPEYLHL